LYGESFAGKRGGKVGKSLGNLGKKREMWGVKDEDFRGFYQRVHFMFPGKYGKKSGKEEDFGEIQRKMRLQLSVISYGLPRFIPCSEKPKTRSK
jgi:hypothetical protein